MFDARDLMDPAFREKTEEEDKFSFQMGLKREPIAMNWADPFRPSDTVPEHVKKAVLESVNSTAAHYSFPIGDALLRQELAKRIKKLNGLEVNPDKNITVVCGSDNIFSVVMRMFLVPGQNEEVMTPVPSYLSNFLVPPLVGGKSIMVPTHAEDGFELDIEEFEKRVTEKTKIVMITNPNNPTGTVYSRSSMEKLADFCIRHNLICIVDQCFEETVYDGHELVNIATLPGMWERTILMSSLSKGMGLCGFRVAYIVASDEITEILHKVGVLFFGAPNTMAQAGAIAALKDPAFVEDYRQEWMARAKILGDIIDTIPHIRYVKPQSGFIFWLDVSWYGNCFEVMEYLAGEANVLVSPGEDYMNSDYIRLVFAAMKDRDECVHAIEEIKAAFLRHPKLGKNAL